MMKRKIVTLLTTALLASASLWATEVRTSQNTENPFTEIEKIQKEMDAVFNRLHQHFLSDTTFSGFQGTFIKTPAADIVDKGDHYLIKADIPGADAKSIKVTEKEGMLTIEAKTENEKKEKGENYVRQERFVGAFSKMMTLPKDADASKLKTDYKNGVLEITIPKRK
jgi:HSP20 family protein